MQLWMNQWDMGQSRYDLFFTIGQNIGRPDCPVPTGGVRWRTFWPLVELDLWQSEKGDRTAPFSTVSQWWGCPTTVYNGEEYEGSKRTEFLRFVDLPRLAGRRFALALNMHPVADRADKHLLMEKGWHVQDAHHVARDFAAYRQYAHRGVRGVQRGKTGLYQVQKWLVERPEACCYLAAGRPGILQETGFSQFLPTGRGLFSFRTMDDILAAVEAIESDYEGHCRAAREIASEYFAAEKVLGKLLHDAGVS